MFALTRSSDLTLFQVQFQTHSFAKHMLLHMIGGLDTRLG